MYKRDAELSRAAGFMQGVARLTNRAFDNILGKKLWSLQAVGVSMWFSLASMWLTALLVSHIHRIAPHPAPSSLHLAFNIIACIGAGMLPTLIGRVWAFVAWAVPLLTLLFWVSGFGLFAIHKYGYLPVLHALATVLLLLFLSFGCDVLYISVTRWMLRKMLRIRQVHELVALIVLDVVLALVLVGGPVELAVAMMKSPVMIETTVAGVVVLMFNFGDFIACSVFFIVMLTVLLHRLMWPILERPIYALHRYGVIRNKKLLWGVGSALLIGPQGFIAMGKYIIQHL